jgi:hypothetical protein
LTQVPVDGAVATKEQNNIRLIRSGWHPDAPVDFSVRLEGLEIFRRTSQSENGGGTHTQRLRVTELLLT